MTEDDDEIGAIEQGHEKAPNPFANQVNERIVMRLVPNKTPKAWRSCVESAPLLQVAHLNSFNGT